MTRFPRGVLLVALALLLTLLLALPAAGVDPLPTTPPTTQVSVILYGFDGVTEVMNRTVDYHWLESNLPVKGNGMTHYFHQGPIYTGDSWDPGETKIDSFNDMNAVKGTALSDLCELVGGMSPGDTLEVWSPDNESRNFSYGTVYSPSARQGQIVLTWYRADDGYVPSYKSGMRTVFYADDSTNIAGWHVFGNNDMKATMPPSEWYYTYPPRGGAYPSAQGLSVKFVSQIRLYPAPRAVAVPGGEGPPRDLDANGKYEDVNGNGRGDFADVVLFFNQMSWIAGNEPVPFFDYNANGRVDFADAVLLFNTL